MGLCKTTQACTPTPQALDRTDTEGGRIAQILSESRRCMAAESLAKARAFASGKACGALCGVKQINEQPPVPLPSMALQTKVANCYNKYQSLEGCVPESVRIARIEQKTIDASTDPNNLAARFSAYERFFPTPCPPLPAWYATAGEPILQGKACALPNKPDNPVLPG